MFFSHTPTIDEEYGLIFEDKIEVYSEHDKPQLSVNSESSYLNIPPVVTNADTGARLDQNKVWAGLFLTKIAAVKSKEKNSRKKRKDSQTSALCGISYASPSDK